MTILLREAIGDRLRHARTSQRRTLREISRTARVSLGYLSEVERGQKEASSELLAAICDALELPLSELMHNVADDMSVLQGVAQASAPLTEQPAEASSGSNMVGGGRMVHGATGELIGNEFADLHLRPVLGTSLSRSLSSPNGVVVAA